MVRMFSSNLCEFFASLAAAVFVSFAFGIVTTM